jgi:murein DD-endopeptidase MepM/ murein hydrolase activator NlpD
MPEQEKKHSGVESPAEILRWLVVRAEEQGRRPPSSGYGQPDEDAQVSQYERPRWDIWLLGTGLRHEWSLSLQRQPTPYTQLGFTNAANLPVTGVRGKGIPVSFTITNDEGRQVSYRYVVASGSGTTLTAISSGTTVIAAGHSWGVGLVVVPKCAAASCRVQVSLPEQDESIDFMLTYPAQSGKTSK